MGLGRKKSSYVSIDDLAKASEVGQPEPKQRAEATATESEPIEPDTEQLEPAAPEIELAASDAEAHLSNIAARVSEARRHISNARVEAIAQQETFGESDVSAEAAAIVAPQGVSSLEAAGSAGFERCFVDDIDEADVEGIENRFFGERPVSIEEGMRKADEAHVRHRKSALVFAIIAVLLVAGLGLVVFGLSGVSSQNGEPSNTDAQVSAQGEGLVDAPPPSMRLYQTNEYGEADVSVYETMEFDKDGLCSKMKLEATFSNGAAAEAFMADMRETHGNNCVESYVDGTTGVVVIDVSSQGMTRDEYLASAGVEFEDPDVQEIPEELTT